MNLYFRLCKIKYFIVWNYKVNFEIESLRLVNQSLEIESPRMGKINTRISHFEMINYFSRKNIHMKIN